MDTKYPPRSSSINHNERHQSNTSDILSVWRTTQLPVQSTCSPNSSNVFGSVVMMRSEGVLKAHTRLHPSRTPLANYPNASHTYCTLQLRPCCSPSQSCYLIGKNVEESAITCCIPPTDLINSFIKHASAMRSKSNKILPSLKMMLRWDEKSVKTQWATPTLSATS